MTAKIICLASAKGGSGKTVLTATIGTYLASLGKKVLLVDTDAATNGLTLLHLKEVLTRSEEVISEGRTPRGIYEIDAMAPNPDVVKLPAGFELAPATYKFENTEQADIANYSSGLSRALRALRVDYDYILLDAQAGSDPFAGISMSKLISDEVIIVSEYDPISAAGVERLKGLFREDLTYVRTWVLLNKMLPEFVQSFSDFLEVAKYLAPIPWDADVVRAYSRRKLALDLENVNEFTLAVGNTVRSLLGDEIENDIARWSESRQRAIREPLHQKYLDAELELKGLIHATKELEGRRVRRRLAVTAAGLLTLMVALQVVWFFTPVRLEVAKWLGEQKGVDLWAFAGLLAVVPAFMMALFLRERFLLPSAREESERRRLERQQRLIEAQLIKLEALQSADIRDLLKVRDIDRL